MPAIVERPDGRTLVTVRGEFPVAPVGTRFVGFLVDYLVLGVIALVVGLTIDSIGAGVASGASDAAVASAIAAAVVCWIVGALWYFNTTGWSPGRHLAGVRIVAGDGGTPGISRGLGRTVGLVISLLPCGLGYMWAGWDRKGQTWHDKMAETYVVRVRE